VRESISLVAQCIRHASLFEIDRNSSSSVATTTAKGGRGKVSFWSNRSDGGGRTARERGVRPILGRGRSDFDLPPFLTRPRRGGKFSIGTSYDPPPGAAPGGRPTHHHPSLAASPADEDVVLKLLSLSVQVLRCPAGRDLLPPGDVVGIFDTCLHVSVVAREGGRSLLRSDAADALGHCVIVVFGLRGGCPETSTELTGERPTATMIGEIGTRRRIFGATPSCRFPRGRISRHRIPNRIISTATISVLLRPWGETRTESISPSRRKRSPRWSRSCTVSHLWPIPYFTTTTRANWGWGSLT